MVRCHDGLYHATRPDRSAHAATEHVGNVLALPRHRLDLHIHYRVPVGDYMSVHNHIDALPSHKKSGVQAYIAGFALAIALTVAAFALVWAYVGSDGAVFSRAVLLTSLTVLAIVQLFVQAVFFLHLSSERKLRLNLYSTFFTIFVVLIIVIGSIWIMYNLNYNMMPRDTTQYIEDEENIHVH